MSKSSGYVLREMLGELNSRRAALLSHRKVLEQAAGEILTIDEKIEAIDQEVVELTARLNALPPDVETPDAQPAA